MKRGDVYYIKYHHTVGSEMAKGRPAIIVSADELNKKSEVVEVVYLTTKPKKEAPTHVGINATGIPSTALCEQVTTVSKSLIGDYFGACTAEELKKIDRALRRSLGIQVFEDVFRGLEPLTIPPIKFEKKHSDDPVSHPSHYTDGRIEVIDYIEDKGLGFWGIVGAVLLAIVIASFL